MKAQSLRRLLTLTNGLLLLGVAGAAGWYFVKVRPAAAEDGKRVEWVRRAMDAYMVDAKNATPTVVYPVDEKALEQITRPDLMDPKRGGPGVWPYVGPIPPKPVVEGPKLPTVEAPKGLAATGHLHTVILASDPQDSVMVWVFNGTAAKKRPFAHGDLIEDKDLPKEIETPQPGAPRKPGMYLVSIAKADDVEDPKARKFKVTYELVSADPKEPVKVAEEIVSTKEETGGKDVIHPAAGTPGAEPPPGAPGTAAAPSPGGPETPPAIELVKIAPVPVGDSGYKIEFDDNAYRYIRYSDPDALIRDVKTEEVKDEKGQPKGLRISGIGKDSVANQFGVVPGDILKSIAGRPVHSRGEALDVVKSLPKETESVAVVIERNGRDLLFNVDPRDPKVRAAAKGFKFQPGK